MPFGNGNGNNPTIRQRAPINRTQPAGQPAQNQQPRAGGISGGISGQRPQQGGGMQQRGGMGQGQQPQQRRPVGGVMGYEAIKAQSEQQAQIEQRRAQERIDGYQPLRFYLPDPTKPGITREELEANIVILDEAPTFAAFEHQFPDPRTGRFGRGAFTHLCLSNEGHCPACDADQKDPYFALFLTIQDMRGYVNQQGVFVPHSKKLLVVKNKNQDYFYRQYERYGTLRGMQLLMIRNDKRGANHGNPEFVEIHPEEAIIQEFQHPRVMSQDNQRVVKEANEDCYAYDYAKLFPKPDYNQMLERFGGAPAAGSRTDYDQTWGQDAGQFNSAQSRGGVGGGISGRSGGIGARTGGGRMGMATSANRQPNQMSGYGNDADYDDSGDGAGNAGGDFQQQMDDDIPFDQSPASSAQGAVRGGAQGGAATSPDDIPL